MKNVQNMTIEELKKEHATAKGIIKTILEALITEKTRAAELQTKLSTSKKRETKAPDAYSILQPMFVTLKSNIGKNIIPDSTIKVMFEADCKSLNIENNLALQCKLWEKTTLHNSTSNIPDKKKTESAVIAAGKLQAYKDMAIQGKVILTLIPAETWEAYEKMVIEAYNKNPFVVAAKKINKA